MKKKILLIPTLALLASCGGNKELLYGHAFIYWGAYINHEAETLDWLADNLSNIQFEGKDATSARMEYWDSNKDEINYAYFNQNSYSSAENVLNEMKEKIDDNLAKSFKTFHSFIFNSGKTNGELRICDNGTIISCQLNIKETAGSSSGESLDFSGYIQVPQIESSGDVNGKISVINWSDNQIDGIDIDMCASSFEENQQLKNKVTFYFPLRNQTNEESVYTVNGWYNYLPVRVK